jgi:hypothetical protein
MKNTNLCLYKIAFLTYLTKYKTKLSKIDMGNKTRTYMN